jgi:DNA-binding response OmpR family regulator
MASKVNPKGYVLVLEDDPLIGPLLERWLGEAGYRVAASSKPDEARPALVIADASDPSLAEGFIRSLQEYAASILILSARFRHGLCRIRGGGASARGQKSAAKAAHAQGVPVCSARSI